MIENENVEQIRRDTEAAIATGSDHANSAWKEAALKVLEDMLLVNEYVTANDFTKAIKGMAIKTHDNRAIAGVVMRARKMGWIEKTGETRSSKAGHLSRVQVWHSKLFIGKPQPSENDIAAGTVEPESHTLFT